MSYKNLLIVESPAKSKTISKYLGKTYKVLASFGHLRQLKKHITAVNVDKDFQLLFESNSKQKKLITSFKKYIEEAEVLYLATDCDREGEAIAWHFCNILNKELSQKKVFRITFNEITKQAITDALLQPKTLDYHLIDAYRTRVTLDFLVGFYLSPLLWKPIGRGLSAGRVQSPALRLLVEREQMIQEFQIEDFWTIETLWILDSNITLKLKLITYEGHTCEQHTFKSQQEAQKAQYNISQACTSLEIINIEEHSRKISPKPPFTTSTLQQAASQELGFNVKKTMKIAQELYEGLVLDSGNIQGLITYMRTDSVSLSQQAIENIATYLQNKGQETLSKKTLYHNTSLNTQEAHESIRPVDVTLEPSKIRSYLTQDQYKLYNLIWCHTIASQMIATVSNTIKILVANKHRSHIFQASTNYISVPGWQTIYQVASQEMPLVFQTIKIGQHITTQEFELLQHHTKPPSRFSESSLIKTLDKFGIGRPSTYESIINTLNLREYVVMDKKFFNVTPIGKDVISFLKEFFLTYIDYNFTATLERLLDEIARGQKSYIDILSTFWKPFYEQVKDVKKLIATQEKPAVSLELDCPQCQHKLITRKGRYGEFIGCSNFPKCKYITTTLSSSLSDELLNQKCQKCQVNLVLRKSRNGEFLGCPNYPACHFMISLNKEYIPQEITDIICPVCKNCPLLKLISKKQIEYYKCSDLENCKSVFYLNNKALCHTCNSLLLKRKVDKKYIGYCIVCRNIDKDSKEI